MDHEKRMTDALINIMRRDLPPAERMDQLGQGRTLFAINVDDEDGSKWDAVWARVMAATGCGSWKDTIDKSKH